MFDPSPQATAGTHVRVEAPPRPTHPSVNGPRLLALAEEIERPTLGVGFNMSEWHKEQSCGTVCCLGGTAQVMFQVSGDWNANWTNLRAIEHAVADALSVDREKAERLFYPDSLPEDTYWASITRPWAAAVVRHLAYTGEVDWSVGAEGGT